MPAPETPITATGMAAAALGEIALIYPPRPESKYRADIRLMSGALLSKVRLPGPGYTEAGLMQGVSNAYQVGQLVLVLFPHNNASNPIVAGVYSHPGGDLSKLNLAKSIDTDLHSDIEIGHRSGYKLKFTDDMIVLYVAGQKTPAITFIPSTSTLTLSGVTVATTGGAPVSIDGPVQISSTLTVLNDLTIQAGNLLLTAGAFTMAAAGITAAGVLEAVNATLGGVLNVLTHRHGYTDDGAPLVTDGPQ